MNEAETFSLRFYVVYSKSRECSQHSIHWCLISWFLGIHWIFDFRILQFITLDSVSADHYFPIPYLQNGRLTNVYLLPPNQSTSCFGVIWEHAQSRESFASSDVTCPAEVEQGKTTPCFKSQNENKYPSQDLFNAMTSTFVCFFVGDFAGPQA